LNNMEKCSSRSAPWLTQRAPRAGEIEPVNYLLRRLNLHTICESGRCPNIAQCLPRGMAFLILGNNCSRDCTFCAVSRGTPSPSDPSEPYRIAEAVKRLKLRYVFLTSVTRDDLPDGGANQFAMTINILKEDNPGVVVEILVPDFQGNNGAIKTVINAKPDVFAHNLETVPRLYPNVRPMADYQTSLEVLRRAKEFNPGIITKSGIMLGMGETHQEILEIMGDLRRVDCDLFTMGQYLAPSRSQYPVYRFVTPEEFSQYEPIGKQMGFRGIVSAPLWRSSFKADKLYYQTITEK
jgi:lipoic acid synthetase